MSNGMDAMTREEREETRLTLRKGKYNRVVVDMKRKQVRFYCGEAMIRSQPFDDLERVDVVFRGLLDDLRVEAVGKISAGSELIDIPDIIRFPVRL